MVGTGGLAKEVVFLCSRQTKYKIKGFVDDKIRKSNFFMGFPILGNIKVLRTMPQDSNILIAVASPQIKYDLYKRISEYNSFCYPSIVDKDALIGINVSIGEGNIIMANSSFTADIKIGNFNLINLTSSIGHDVKIGSFNSIFPNASISGSTTVGDFNSVGVGAKVLQNLVINNNVTIGAGAVVVKDTHSNSTYVGIPAKKLERSEIDE